MMKTKIIPAENSMEYAKTHLGIDELFMPCELEVSYNSDGITRVNVIDSVEYENEDSIYRVYAPGGWIMAYSQMTDIPIIYTVKMSDDTKKKLINQDRHTLEVLQQMNINVLID